MTDTLERDHIDAALALLRADSGLTVYPNAEGFVPTTLTVPYVRVYTSIERPETGVANALDGLSATWVVRWYCHCVGGTEYSAAAVAMHVRAAVLDRRPTVSGRVCGLIRQESSQPTQRDESTGVAVYDRVDVYRMASAPG